MDKAKQIMETNQEALSSRKLQLKLKAANFMKKAGFYPECEAAITDIVENEIDANTPKMFLYRLYRDQARIFGILNRNEEAEDCFLKAADQIPGDKSSSLKYAKLLFYKGLANKRVKSSIAISWFLEAIALLEDIAGTDQNHLVAQSMIELGTVYKREEKYDDAQSMYTSGGEFMSEYSNLDVYGERKGKKHPLMQTYLLVEIDWANGAKLVDNEKHFLKEYTELVQLSNPMTGQNEGKESIFMLEALFQELQHEYYCDHGQYTPVNFEEKIKAMDIIMMDHGVIESNQLINWCKVFQATTMYGSGQQV